MKKQKRKNRKHEIDDLTEQLDKLIAFYKKLDAACDAATETGTLDPNGPLWEAIWRGFEGALEFGLDGTDFDSDKWTYWYIWDNQCGVRELTAGYDKKVKPICSTRDLAKLILKGRNRK